MLHIVKQTKEHLRVHYIHTYRHLPTYVYISYGHISKEGVIENPFKGPTQTLMGSAHGRQHAANVMAVSERMLAPCELISPSSSSDEWAWQKGTPHVTENLT